MHQTKIDIYYEDTDAIGVVYHANYLKYFERGRTCWIKDQGYDLNTIHQEHQLAFVVKSLQTNFLKPAKLHDILIVQTTVCLKTPYRSQWHQIIKRDNTVITEQNSEIVCINQEQKLCVFPTFLSSKMTVC